MALWGFLGVIATIMLFVVSAVLTSPLGSREKCIIALAAFALVVVLALILRKQEKVH